MSEMLLTGLLPAVLLIGGFLLCLMRAGYPHIVAAALAMLALSQAGAIVAIVGPGHSLWLAAGVGAVAASASAFAEREDAHRIILVGGSLAAVQLCDPMGGLLAAGLLPAALAIGRGQGDLGKTAGLYALVLFLPVMMALVLLYLSRVHHIDAPTCSHLARLRSCTRTRAPALCRRWGWLSSWRLWSSISAAGGRPGRYFSSPLP